MRFSALNSTDACSIDFIARVRQQNLLWTFIHVGFIVFYFTTVTINTASERTGRIAINKVWILRLVYNLRSKSRPVFYSWVFYRRFLSAIVLVIPRWLRGYRILTLYSSLLLLSSCLTLTSTHRIWNTRSACRNKISSRILEVIFSQEDNKVFFRFSSQAITSQLHTVEASHCLLLC